MMKWRSLIAPRDDDLHGKPLIMPPNNLCKYKTMGSETILLQSTKYEEVQRFM